MDYSEFKRESLVRHQSEKLLDRNIVSFERVFPSFSSCVKNQNRNKYLMITKK